MESDKGSRASWHKEGQASLQDEALRPQGRGGARRGREPVGLELVFACLLTFALLICLSCGYTASTTLPSHIKTVAIPLFKNETLEYGIEEEITNAVIQKFVNDNRLRVVGEKEGSSILLGTVRSYKRSVFSYSVGEVAQEYEVTVKVSVEFQDVVKGRIIWKDDSLISSARYFAVDMAGHKAQTEQEGRTPAIEFLASDILTRTVEGW